MTPEAGTAARVVLLFACVSAASIVVRSTSERATGDGRVAGQGASIDIRVLAKSMSWQWQLTGLPVDETIDATLPTRMS